MDEMLTEAYEHILVLEHENSTIRGLLNNTEEKLEQRTKMLDVLQSQLIGI